MQLGEWPGIACREAGLADLIPDVYKDSRFRLKACFIGKMEPMYKPRATAKAKLTATPEPKPELPEVTPAAVPEPVAMGVTVPEPVAMAITVPTPESPLVPESMLVFKPWFQSNVCQVYNPDYQLSFCLDYCLCFCLEDLWILHPGIYLRFFVSCCHFARSTCLGMDFRSLARTHRGPLLDYYGWPSIVAPSEGGFCQALSLSHTCVPTGGVQSSASSSDKLQDSGVCSALRG